MKNWIRAPFIGAFVALLAMSTGAIARHQENGHFPQTDLAAQAQIEDLAVCYARGTDTLGRAVNAVISGADPEDTVNIGDPEFDAALALYRQCFSEDFSFSLEFVAGSPILTVPNPAGGGGQDGALQWANFVNNAFRGPGYINTQHHMGSISSEIHGHSADMVSYLIATHSHGAADPAPNTGVSIVGGTYTDEVVFEKGRWVILQRTLLITSQVTNP
jgi:hypothetical protein